MQKQKGNPRIFTVPLRLIASMSRPIVAGGELRTPKLRRESN